MPGAPNFSILNVTSTERSKKLSISLRILLPLAIIAMPMMSFALTSGNDRTALPTPILTRALSTHGTMAGPNSTPIGMDLITSLDKVPSQAGEQVNITFTVKNTAPARTKASLNNVTILSRYLATNNDDLTIYKFEMPLNADAFYSASVPYTYNGTQDLNQLLSSVQAKARFDIYEYREPLTTSNPVATTLPKYTGPAVRSVTQSDTYWGKFALTAGFDRKPSKAGEQVNIVVTVKSGNSIPGNKPRLNKLRNVTLFSRLLDVPGQNPNSTQIYMFPQQITETNEITWSTPYTYKGNENLVDVLMSISAVGTATFSTYNVVLQTGTPTLLPNSNTVPVTTTRPPVVTVPTTTVPATVPTTVPVTTVPVPNGPEIEISRVLRADGSFAYTIENKGRNTLGDIQVLDNEASSASFNVVNVIAKLEPNSAVTFVAKKIDMVQGGFGCQAWYHPVGSPTGIGVPCKVSVQGSPQAAGQNPSQEVTTNLGWVAK